MTKSDDDVDDDDENDDDRFDSLRA